MTQRKESETEPLWKDEFSVESAHEALVNRRQFTKFLTLTSLGMFVGNLWILAKPLFDKEPKFPRKVVGDDSLPVGAVKLFRYPTDSDPCIMVHTDKNNFVAYTQKCTHLACPVYYSAATKRLECPCHEGSFSVESGEVIKGPPPRPLPRVILERQNGLLVAVGIEAGPEDNGSK
ncbi:MAG TPA: Rieske 2Fe-2S domain-containing protein [Candidatus Obscuribacterales bacterium]